MRMMILLFMTLPFSLNAGYLIKESIRQGSGRTDSRSTYVSEDGIRMEDTESITIMKVVHGQVRIYRVNKVNKTYQDLSEIAPMMAIGFTFLLRCDRDGCKIDKEAIKPTEEFKKVGRWKARKLRIKVRGMMGEQISWYTKDYPELISARRLWGRATKKMLKALSKEKPELLTIIDALEREGERIIKEYGVSVMDEVSVGGVKTISSVEEVKRVKIAPSLFAIPPGYKKVEIGIPHFPKYQR